MSVEYPGRIHGDGRLIIDQSFYSPVGKEETPQYVGVLKNILNTVGIDLKIDPADPTLPSALLALKQRFMIGFSNGCPWPEKAIGEYLEDHKTASMTIEELTEQIQMSATYDGKHNILFQDMLSHASKSLQEELLSYHPWTPLKGQEDRNLPKDITEPSHKGKGAYGLAYDPPYFDVLIPLYKYIDDDQNDGNKQSRFFAVTDFLEQKSATAKSIQTLVEQSKEFLHQPQSYLDDFLK